VGAPLRALAAWFDRLTVLSEVEGHLDPFEQPGRNGFFSNLLTPSSRLTSEGHLHLRLDPVEAPFERLPFQFIETVAHGVPEVLQPVIRMRVRFEQQPDAAVVFRRVADVCNTVGSPNGS